MLNEALINRLFTLDKFTWVHPLNIKKPEISKIFSTRVIFLSYINVNVDIK